MMASQIHQHIIWTFIVNYMLVQADIGDVNLGLRYHAYKCLCNSDSLHECLTQQTLCLKSSVFRCLRFHEPLRRYYSEIGTLCGVINTGRQLTPQTWHIIVHSKFSIHFEFVHFHLPVSPHCASGTRVSVDTTIKVYTYCGYRRPWYISFKKSGATVKCNSEYQTPTGFHFVMIFQAFDIKSPSVVPVKWHEMDLHPDALFPIDCVNHAIGRKRRFMGLSEIQLHLTARIGSKIRITLNLAPTNPMRIYDGPGILSPVIQPEPNTTRPSILFSSYKGFVTYYNNSTCDLFFSWDTPALNFSDNCKNHGSHRGFKGTYGKCQLLSSGVLTIHQMQFVGYNMMGYDNNIRQFYSRCHYGGLIIITDPIFIDNRVMPDEYITICSDITSGSIFPIGNIRLQLLFITFQGYSSGFIDLTFSRDDVCFGENMVTAKKPSSAWDLTTRWADSQATWPIPSGLLETPTTCTDVWILNNIGEVGHIYSFLHLLPFENLSVVLDHSSIAFLVGPFNMTVSTTFITHSSFSSMSTDIPWLGNMNVEVNVLKRFPTQTTTETVNFSMPLSVQHSANFTSSILTVFHVSNPGSDRFPVFAIRIQFTEHVICSGNIDKFSLYPRIYTIEDVLNVYLPRDHPLKELFAYVYDYHGYNQGTCRTLIAGRKCSQSISHHQIVRIHYVPHEELVLPYEIDISMKKTVNCSIECSLDIGILEFMHINDTTRFRYHEWRSIYRLTWQIIAAKSRGFSLTINSTCNTCIKLCNIAVAIGLPLTSNKILPSTATHSKYLEIFKANILFDRYYRVFANPLLVGRDDNVINSLSHLHAHVFASRYITLHHMYGNWYDAKAYCLARNSSLLAHTLFLLNQLTYLMDIVDPDFGWKQSQGLYFADFHRNGSVSGLHSITT